jgi:16S rRNA A1518/A1519 N6-dimethyltransferase RsmA/KsgA/DIM1 with predicted DNA glycosylase/AP lyase activity
LGFDGIAGDPRPEYPEWVYATLASGCGLRRNASVFEIGAGTDTAKRRLLDLGADPLTVVEPDQRLADFLRTNNPDKALRHPSTSVADGLVVHTLTKTTRRG